jgi:O-acetyl-ADP-ribose deacetylase (regulator of RNase III)
MKDKVSVVLGDITKQNVDAIVNAANSTLLGGGGVDGAIHRAAGPKLLEECRTLNGCETGEVKLTKGYNLPADFVIHTVGPVWNGGNNNEEKLLENCYKNSLKLAVENKIKSIAFPSISTGVYRFPFEKACNIAVNSVKNFLRKNNKIEKILFVCFSQNDFETYNKVLDEIF